MAELTLDAVSKRYGEQRVLDGISLSAPAGAYVCLLGPSGSGKSTLLRGIAGLVALDAGRIVLGGRELSALPPEARELGMVFQSYAVWPHKTVFDNVAYPLVLRRERDLARAVEAALGRVGLDGFGPRMPASLSGGQQQRVALARALVMKPQALLLDEPLANLDPHLRADLCDEFRRISRERGLLFLHVTHDREEALSLASDLVVLDGGRLIEHGPPERLFHSPETRFVAEFVAEGVSLTAATLRAAGARVSVTLEGGGTLEAEWRGRSAPEAHVALVLPQHGLSVDPAGAIAARVEGVAYRGTHWVASVRLTSGAVARVTLRSDAPRPTPGESLNLRPAVAWAFPAEPTSS